MASKRRLQGAGNGQRPNTKTLQVRKQRQQLVRFTALRDQDGDVVGPHNPEVAVHAAMNVVEPVLDARDTEILRLRRLMGGNSPRR